MIELTYTISDRYGVTPKEVRQWNGLKSNRLASGRRLTLYVDNGGVAFASATKSKTTQKTTSSSEIVEKQSDGFISYKVKSGDSLYTISKKYPGVSAALIQKANGLSNANIRPGQVLKIPVG